MTRLEVWLMHASNFLVAVSGIIYAVMKYGMPPLDEFSVLNHPWQGVMLQWHIVLAPTLVLLIGIIWRSHVLAQWRYSKRKRVSGIALVMISFPMIFSGYLIQVSGDGLWHSIWLWVHLISAGLWVISYLAHDLAQRI